MLPRPPQPDRPDSSSGRDRRRSAAAEAAASRTPTVRQLSRAARDQIQRRLLLGAVGGAAMIALLIVGFGLFRELVAFPNEPVALIAGDRITLRSFTDALAEEMRSLQTQAATGARDETNPGAMGSQVSRLIEAQEKLPEEVLEKEIENLVIRVEADRRGIKATDDEIDKKINEFLAVQRDLLNQPTGTPTETATPRPTATATPEGFVPSPTPTRTPTADPLTPSPTPTASLTPTLSPTLDPLTPTATRTPFPTRPTVTPIVTPSLAPTLDSDEFRRAYEQIRPALKSEARYRASFELQVLREKLRLAIGANLPTSGPLARVLRIATSTKDEATIARLQLVDFDYPLEEVLAQAGDRPTRGRVNGDLGWVAKGGEAPEFDDVVFSPGTALDEWTQPFQAAEHHEIVKVLERRAEGPHDQKNMDKLRDRAFKEWLDSRKADPDIIRELSAQERQWAVDRASKGIIETTTDRRARR